MSCNVRVNALLIREQINAIRVWQCVVMVLRVIVFEVGKVAMQTEVPATVKIGCNVLHFDVDVSVYLLHCSHPRTVAGL